MLPSTKWGVAQLHNLVAHLLHEQTCSSPPTPIRSNRPLIPPPAQVTGRRGRSPADTGFPPQPPHIRLPNLFLHSAARTAQGAARVWKVCGQTFLGVHSPLSRTIQPIMGYWELGGPTALSCLVLSGEVEVVNTPNEGFFFFLVIVLGPHLQLL